MLAAFCRWQLFTGCLRNTVPAPANASGFRTKYNPLQRLTYFAVAAAGVLAVGHWMGNSQTAQLLAYAILADLTRPAFGTFG